MPRTRTRSVVPKVRRAPPKVLIVDDDPRVLVAVARDLGLEFDPLIAQDSDEALRMLRNTSGIRAVICHLNIPRGRLAGSELLAEVSRVAPKCARVVFSRSPSWEYVQDFAHAFVPRPWNPGEMQRTVRKTLRRIAA